MKGSGATVLEPGREGSFLRVVHIAANDVVFGSPQRGFTIANDTSEGISNTAAGLTVAEGTSRVVGGGNLAVGLVGTGFIVLGGSNHRLEGNLAVGGQEGFRVEGAGVLVVDNLAPANSAGVGFILAASGLVVTGNVASDNARSGFAVWGPGASLTSNIASGNLIDGFELRGDGIVMSRNHALATCEPIGTSIQRGNIIGNNPTGVSGLLNCGLVNFDTTGPPVNATGNWWGRASGPGLEPSDAVCGPGQVITGPYLQAPAAVNAVSPF